jgi:hypothetical protein
VREFLRRGIVADVSCAGGKIICMSSVHQETPQAEYANYATSPAAYQSLMELVPYRRIAATLDDLVPAEHFRDESRSVPCARLSPPITLAGKGLRI